MDTLSSVQTGEEHQLRYPDGITGTFILSTIQPAGDNNHGGKRHSRHQVHASKDAPSYAWNLKDWNTVGQTQLVEENRVWGGSSGNRTEEVTVGSNVSRSTRIYYKYDWGEELVGFTKGGPTLRDHHPNPTTAGERRPRTGPRQAVLGEAYEYHPSELGHPPARAYQDSGGPLDSP